MCGVCLCGRACVRTCVREAHLCVRDCVCVRTTLHACVCLYVRSFSPLNERLPIRTAMQPTCARLRARVCTRFDPWCWWRHRHGDGHVMIMRWSCRCVHFAAIMFTATAMPHSRRLCAATGTQPRHEGLRHQEVLGSAPYRFSRATTGEGRVRLVCEYVGACVSAFVVTPSQLAARLSPCVSN